MSLFLVPQNEKGESFHQCEKLQMGKRGNAVKVRIIKGVEERIDEEKGMTKK